MEVIINNIHYQIDEGAVYIQNYNEELDSATIRISHLKEELDIEPFDKVQLISDAFTDVKHMCIDEYDTIQEGLDNPTYVYNITLVSQTKLLENIILPNISITPHKINKKLSIATYIKRYVNLYANDMNWSFNETELDEKFSDDCPELQWNMPTLREVLTDLMMVKDCIPTLGNGIISWIDLTEKKDKISGNINYISKSQSSNDYTSELRMQLQNVIQTPISGIDNTVDTWENLTFVCENYVVSDDNLKLQTQFPILNIKHLYLSCYYYDNTQQLKIFKLDLCDLENTGASLVYEKNEYSVLPLQYRTENINTSIANYTVTDYFSKYQNYCIYFTRGGREISGFSNVQKGILGNFNRSTYEWIKAIAFSKVDGRINPSEPNQINQGYTILALTGYFNTFFQIEYETNASFAFSASKKEKIRNKRVTIDNQTNSWVDAYNQGFLEYQKINRIGNQKIMINQRSISKNDLISIGQTYEDNIIYRTEYEIFNNHIEVNAYATKNYILQNYFTGVKSKIRTWVNAQNEAFERVELNKKYCVFSFNEGTNIDYANYLLSPFKNSSLDLTASPIKYAVISTNNDVDEKYLMNCITRFVGSSIVFTICFTDNWFIAKRPNQGTHEEGETGENDGYIASTDIDVGYVGENNFYPPGIKNYFVSQFGGIPLYPIKYVNEEGEFTYINLEYIDNYNRLSPSINSIIDDYIKPEISENNTYTTRISDTLYMYKDNKEIPVINTQLEFLTDTNDIVVTENFLMSQKCIRNYRKSNTILYFVPKSSFNPNHKNLSEVDNYLYLPYASISVIDNQITLNDVPTSGMIYICLYDRVLERGEKILMMINAEIGTTFYLNVSNER